MDVSVVIPCLNRERLLPRAIESALGQEPAPREVVVVDDGSSDGSAAAAEAFGPPVRVLRGPHRGVSAARNRGIAAAAGSWVAFLDSDDVWLPGKLWLQAEAAAAFPDAAVLFCDTQAVDAEGVRLASRFDLGGVRGSEAVRRGELLRFDRSLFPRLLTASRIFTSAVVARREIEGLRFPESARVAEDWALWLDLCLRYPFAAVDRVLVRMHYGGDNLSARRGPTERAAARILEELSVRGGLDAAEREAVREALRMRRVGAVYHSLVEGEPRKARPFLARLRAHDLGRARWLAYGALTLLPGPLVRRLAAIARRREE